jgi:hypothetical protein
MTVSNMRKLAAVERHLATLGRVHEKVGPTARVIVFDEMVVMEAIAADYKLLVERETLRLFAGQEVKGEP